MDAREANVSLDSLMEQASWTADGYLFQAIETVEKRMGKGAAERFPQIVAAVIQAAAQDFQAGVLTARVAPALQEVAAAIRESGESLRDAIGDAGQNIAAGLSD